MNKFFIKCALQILLFFTLQVNAQDARFKLGVGVNYISNNYDETYLNDFAAYSLNTAYTLLQQPRFSVAWEQNLLLRQRENDRFRKRAFIASFPVTFRYQASTKTGVYAGLGPAYLTQRYEDYSIRQKVQGLHATALAGVALQSKPFAEVLFLEYHIRAGVHRSMGSSGNMAPFLSVMVQLGANQRVRRMQPSEG